MATRLHHRRHQRQTCLDLGAQTPLVHGDDEFRIWMRHPDDPSYIHSLADATELAWDLPLLPAEREVLVLLDDDRRVVALLFDPPAVLGVLVGCSDLTDVVGSFAATLSVVLVDELPTPGQPFPEPQRIGYHSLRRFHAVQGLHLLDVLLTDGARVVSLAEELDPDPSWDEAYDAGP